MRMKVPIWRLVMSPSCVESDDWEQVTSAGSVRAVTALGYRPSSLRPEAVSVSPGGQNSGGQSLIRFEQMVFHNGAPGNSRGAGNAARMKEWRGQLMAPDFVAEMLFC